MKKLFFFFSFLLFLPLALALYGGETWNTTFDKCDNLLVNISANLTIDLGEYEILNDCEEIETNIWGCDCEDNYNFSIRFKINTVNNYNITFSLNFTEEEEESSSSSSGSSVGGGYSRSWESL